MPHWAQQTAAFVVACLILTGLFVGALMGWFGVENTALIVRLCIAVAGAGFANFLMGYLHLHLPLGVKAGGALGVFALLWLIDPGENIPRAVNEPFQKCQRNTSSEAYDAAVGPCRSASKQLPDNYEPDFLLGKAYYHLGKQTLAIQAWEKAIEKGADPAPLRYSIGLGLLEEEEFQDALAASKEAASETTDPYMLARIWYLAGDANKGLWNFGEGSQDTFSHAVERYQAFLDVGSPTYRAEAELACLFARKAELTSDAAQKAAYETKAMSYFKDALSSIKNHNVPNDADEKAAFAKNYRKGSSDPCADVLASLWEKHNPNEDYSAMLLAIDN